ncbi:GAF and ANTAR domain-containing protein [Saccharothrix sp. Mg75]|uniref:GAF and ANTAR domain-containing protein n=1 Tax=Saccharothrix sp. Mg75 TaxID=3445357 RepID=UPI003EEE289B
MTGAESRGDRPADLAGTRHDLAVRLSEVAQDLHARKGTQETLDEIVRAAVGTIPGAWHAGLMTVVGRREIRTVSGTGDVVFEVDRLQYEAGEGPCLTALFTEKVVSVPELAADARWPVFGSRAHATGVHSMLSFQLYVRDDDLGALNLYSPDERGFDEDSRHVGVLFASHAAVAMADARKEEHLTEAVHTRDLIGQAKGILMERHKLTADQAFSVLVRVSQQSNTKLRDLAQQLVETGRLTPAAR